MASTSELRARDAAVSKKLDGTIEEQKILLDEHIDIQVHSPFQLSIATTPVHPCCRSSIRTERLTLSVQKQLTENQVQEQKANVAAMRADVTADTTQIAHKILR